MTAWLELRGLKQHTKDGRLRNEVRRDVLYGLEVLMRLAAP